MAGSQTTFEIKLQQAKKIVLQAAGLASKSPFGTGKDGVYNAINHLGYIQIDTISVVARAHHHVLGTRVPNYDDSWLRQLQEEKRVLEYWAHAASYLPMEDYRFTMPKKEKYRLRNKERSQGERSEMKRVLAKIKSEGPMKARDFAGDKNKKSSGWWDWKPAKTALERLFFEGSLLVSSREGFQKVYDLPENVIPLHINREVPTQEEYASYLIRRAIQSHGIVTADEVPYLRRQVKGVVRQVLDEMVEAEEVVPVKVKGLEKVYYGHPSVLEDSFRMKPLMHVLSPFDNLTIQRRRLADIFGFDYQIECYVPEPKRKYGYFCLPVIYGTQFVGRVDLKADRKNGTLLVKNIFLEEDVKEVEDQIWGEALRRFCNFNGCHGMEFLNPKNNELSKRLSKML